MGIDKGKRYLYYYSIKLCVKLKTVKMSSKRKYNKNVLLELQLRMQ
jgi:hypothetical protein